MTPSSARTAHPPGLYVLFFTEMWERYSFYSMSAILTLYMDEALRFDARTVGQIYGAYIGAVYLTPLAGGLIADRVLGFQPAVLLGGAVMMAGHLVLSVDARPFFYAGLVLIACGSGLFKPNISTIVGNLYRDRPELRDAGFNLFYLGINLGGFMAPLMVATLRARYGWNVAFGSAAAAMLLSIVIFSVGRGQLGGAVDRVAESAPEALAISRTDVRRRIQALLLVFLISALFWLAFYQDGFTLTFWARDNTMTTIAPERFRSIEPLAVIFGSAGAVALWSWMRRQHIEPSTPSKMLLGIVWVAAAFGLMALAAFAGGDTGRVSPAWLVAAYVMIATGEVFLSPMGLSLVNRVAPPRSRGLMMGGWFFSLSAGGYLSGYIGGYWNTMPHSRFFLLVVTLLTIAAVCLALATRRIRRVLDQVEHLEAKT
jgi:POT family proton-dependent oligopeptide transporter